MLIAAPLLAVVLCTALWFAMGRPRFLTHGPALAKDVKLSVIIPARNEEHNLPKLLESFSASTQQPHEIIVIDDGSTDATAEVARSYQAKVIQPAPLPADWKGKPWACQEGARQATGDWLLFLDADVWLEPNALERLASLTSDSRHVSSLCPFHQIGSWVEELSAFFNLIMVAGSNAFGIPSSTREDSALFGQCLLLSKSTYEQIDGHQRVKDKVLENFHLAQHLKEEGFIPRCFLGKGVLSMRMFSEGLPTLWKSWKKGFTSGATQTSPRILLLISLWLTAGMIILVGLGSLPFGDTSFQVAIAAAYLLFAIQCGWAFRQVGSFSLLNALLFPLSLLFYQVLFFTALIEKKRGIETDWKGRDVS